MIMVTVYRLFFCIITHNRAHYYVHNYTCKYVRDHAFTNKLISQYLKNQALQILDYTLYNHYL